MARGKKRQQYKRQALKEQQKKIARAKAQPGIDAPLTPEQEDIPWTAERPQPVRRAFGIFKVGKIDFIGHQKIFLILSGTLILISLVSLLVRGLNYGIDFTGGNAYTLQFQQDVKESQIRDVLVQNGVQDPVIRIDSNDPKEAIVRTPYLDEAAEAKVFADLEAKFPGVVTGAGDAISPTIGSELVKDSLIATLLACLGILIYVAVRFEYRFAAAGVIALIHDSLITIGVFSVFHLEVTTTFVAAILTVIGFSINDTVVVFDRIRDNLKRRGKEGLDALANRSINETFVRSVNTNITAFLAVAAVFFFGGPTTRDFALAMMVGTIVGSYSTICIATPIWLWWRKRDERIKDAEVSKSMRPKAVRG